MKRDSTKAYEMTLAHEFGEQCVDVFNQHLTEVFAGEDPSGETMIEATHALMGTTSVDDTVFQTDSIGIGESTVPVDGFLQAMREQFDMTP